MKDDFTDWNGRKRKSQYRAPLENPTRAIVKPRKRDRPTGIKVKVDRYIAMVKALRQGWQWRRDSQIREREHGKRDFSYSWRNNHLLWYIAPLRKLKQKFIKEDCYQRVLEETKKRGFK